MKSRRQRTSRALGERPIYRQIMDQAVLELTERGFDRFNIQSVLENAGVSRATLYRYFPDVDGLIEAALVETFREEADRILAFYFEIVDRSTNLASFRDGIRRIFDDISLIPSLVRSRRIHVFALTATRPALAQGIAEVQEMLTGSWERIIAEAQQKGFIRGDLDARALAVMVQAMGVGRIIDDAVVNHVPNQIWADICFDIIDRAVLVQTD